MTMERNGSPDMHKWVHRTCRWPCSKHPNWLAGWVSSREQSAGNKSETIHSMRFNAEQLVRQLRFAQLNAKSCNDKRVRTRAAVNWSNEWNEPTKMVTSFGKRNKTFWFPSTNLPIEYSNVTAFLFSAFKLHFELERERRFVSDLKLSFGVKSWNWKMDDDFIRSS